MKWISVKEKFPEPYLDVLCYMKDGTMAVGCYDSLYEYGDWRINIDEGLCQQVESRPLYWMPLPEPPTTEENCDV